MDAQVRQFQDKVVLVTGAGRGIGKRLAMGFAAEGANVGLLARSKAELDLTRLEIEDAGGTAVPLRADVSKYPQIRSAVEKLEGKFGEVDILVCAAGVQGPVGPLVEADPKAWAQSVETNLLGVFTACRAVLPGMVKRRRGKIIVLGGGGTMKARPSFSAYAASKAALVRLVETMAEEVRDHNVQINALGPGPTYTHMTDEILSAGDKAGWKDSEEARKLRRTGGTPPKKQIELA
ncbi:MAG: SDR family oxidoreductase, partial [bacterium]|nr:SDR family oxidoreductase [bacterium]